MEVLKHHKRIMLQFASRIQNITLQEKNHVVIGTIKGLLLIELRGIHGKSKKGLKSARSVVPR